MKVMERYKNLTDSYNKLSKVEDQILVQEIKACFHMRNGKLQEDGSIGEIKITPKELNDALSYILLLTNPDYNI